MLCVVHVRCECNEVCVCVCERERERCCVWCMVSAVLVRCVTGVCMCVCVCERDVK